MNPVGERVVAALQQKFPNYDVVGREIEYGNVLCVGFDNRAEGDARRRWAFGTPRTLDYRRMDYREVLARMEEIRPKDLVPA